MSGAKGEGVLRNVNMSEMESVKNNALLCARQRGRCHLLRLLCLVGGFLLYASATVAQDAATLSLGSVDYEEVLTAMPAYSEVMTRYEALAAQYADELRADEEEFQARYEEFLANQATYAPAILRKRQAELEELLQRNEQFQAEAARLLAQAKQEMLQPLYARADSVVAVLAKRYALALVVNTAPAAAVAAEQRPLAYVDAALVVDLTAQAKEMVEKE